MFISGDLIVKLFKLGVGVIGIVVWGLCIIWVFVVVFVDCMICFILFFLFLDNFNFILLVFNCKIVRVDVLKFFIIFLILFSFILFFCFYFFIYY